VFKVLEHDQGAQQWFFGQFKDIVWKLINALSKELSQRGGAAATEQDEGPRVWTGLGRPAAEDTFQKAFWHLFQKLPQWSGGNLYAWVRRCTTIYLISRLRKNRRGIELQRLGERDPAGSSSDNPETKLAVLECLEKVLRGLGPELRQLLEMFRAGQSPEQKCKALGVSRRTYFKRLAEIKDRLKDCLEEE
jgi:RNA polymerase sigma factor (sigma-70 family)